MLNENYKNALNGFKAQGGASHLFKGCEAESQHIYRIIMTENVSVDEISEAMLEKFLTKETEGKTDYSKAVDHDGLKYVDIEQDVVIYPWGTKGTTTFPIENKAYLLSSIDSKSMLSQLRRMGRLNLITDTIQSLVKRQDGTNLQTAFPSLDEVKSCIDDGLILPHKLLEKIKEWEKQNCLEINFDFVEK